MTTKKQTKKKKEETQIDTQPELKCQCPKL